MLFEQLLPPVQEIAWAKRCAAGRVQAVAWMQVGLRSRWVAAAASWRQQAGGSHRQRRRGPARETRSCIASTRCPQPTACSARSAHSSAAKPRLVLRPPAPAAVQPAPDRAPWFRLCDWLQPTPSGGTGFIRCAAAMCLLCLGCRSPNSLSLGSRVRLSDKDSVERGSSNKERRARRHSESMYRRAKEASAAGRGRCGSLANAAWPPGCAQTARCSASCHAALAHAL